MVGTAILTMIVLAVVFAPWVTSHDPEKQNLRGRFTPPQLTHPLGTDQFGRDIFSRALYGGRISLTVGLASVLLAVTIGVLVGLQAGFIGGRTDALLMRLTDAIMAFPTFFLTVAISALVGPSLTNLVVIIGLTSWMGVARLVRGEVLSLKEREFISAAVVTGCSPSRVMVRHLLPNTVAPIIVAATLQIAFAVLTEATLSFLGVGVRPPTPSWGNMLTVAQKDMFVAPWVAIAPGGLIFLTVLCLNFVGDGLRDSLDPRLRQR
jgi:peptide/nickel transport system permease protein